MTPATLTKIAYPHELFYEFIKNPKMNT